MKIKILLGIGWFIKNSELEHKCWFLLSRGGSAGLNVQMLARPAWCRSLGIYGLLCYLDLSITVVLLVENIS